MPLCSIEEAWNTKPFNDLPKFGVNDTCYSNASYQEEDKGYNNSNNKYFSRSYNRLPETSGSPSRLINNDSQMNYVRSEYDNVLDYPSNHPSLMNQDLPINEFNLKMYDKINDEQLKKKNNKKDKEKFNNYDNFSLSSEQMVLPGEQAKRKEQKIINNNDTDLMEIISELKMENKKLKSIINDLKSQKLDEKDSLFDLVVYLSTGVIVIFMMENVSKLIRRF